MPDVKFPNVLVAPWSGTLNAKKKPNLRMECCLFFCLPQILIYSKIERRTKEHEWSLVNTRNKYIVGHRSFSWWNNNAVTELKVLKTLLLLAYYLKRVNWHFSLYTFWSCVLELKNRVRSPENAWEYGLREEPYFMSLFGSSKLIVAPGKNHLTSIAPPKYVFVKCPSPGYFNRGLEVW